MKEKQNIIIFVISGIILLGLGILIGYIIKPNQECINNNNNNQEEQTELKESMGVVEDFEFKLLSNKFSNGTSAFELEITNKANEKKYLEEFQMKVKKANQEEITLSGVVKQELEKNESTTITISCGDDLSGYESIVYEIEEQR